MLVLFGCTGEPDKIFNRNYLNEILETRTKVNKVLIIPGSGCPGCISDAEQFVKLDVKKLSEEYLIIFTNIGSVKLLTHRIGKDLIEYPLIFLDKKDGLHFRSIYPILVDRSSDEIQTLKELNIGEIGLY